MLFVDYCRKFKKDFRKEFNPLRSANTYEHFWFDFDDEKKYKKAVEYVKAHQDLFESFEEKGEGIDWQGNTIYTLDLRLSIKDLRTEIETEYDAQIIELKNKLQALKELKKAEVWKKRKEMKIKELQEELKKMEENDND